MCPEVSMCLCKHICVLTHFKASFKIILTINNKIGTGELLKASALVATLIKGFFAQSIR